MTSQRAHAALKKLGRRKRPEFGLIIVDEAHRASSSTKQYGEILAELPHKARLGLTATPYRGMQTDAHRFARVFSRPEHAGRNYPTAIFQRSVEQIEAGPLPGGAKLFARSEPHRVTTGFHLRLEADGESDFVRYLGAFDDPARNRKIVDTYLKFFASRGPAIIFCLNIVHANKIARSINERDGAAQAFYGGDTPKKSTVWPLGGNEMNRFERGRVLEAFRDGQIRVLCCVQLLTEGFDLPGIAVVMLARPTMSTLLMTQMIGRGLRGPAVGGSEVCHIVDFCDQVEIHRKRDAAARLRVAHPSDAERFRRGELAEREGIPADEA